MVYFSRMDMECNNPASDSITVTFNFSFNALTAFSAIDILSDKAVQSLLKRIMNMYTFLIRLNRNNIWSVKILVSFH